MSNQSSRTQNALKNTIWAIFTQIVIVIVGMLNRKVFLQLLGSELLGVNALFSDVLMLFSFADLGFGTAIMFSMYKPIAENDEKKVASMLLLYRTMYRYVIVVLSVISLCFIPFLKYIKTEIAANSLILYYFVFQLINISEYVWAYRESYVIAKQQERELTVINLFYGIAKNLIQIIAIFVAKSYVAYLLIGMICMIIKKIVMNSYIVNKYPITRLLGAQKLSKEEITSIIKKSYALMVTKVGNLIINQTDSVIVSYIISVAQWGLASNYLMIKKALFLVTDKIYGSVLPSMGNLMTEADKQKQLRVFGVYDFLNAWIHTFFFTGLVCLSSPFVELFFDKSALLPNHFVFVFFFASFIDGLRSPISVMREAGGTFEKDKWYTIVAAAVNIVVSIPLAYMFGLPGVYIGTVCAMTVLHVTRTVVFFNEEKYAISAIAYLKTILKHVVEGILICVITFECIKLVDCLSCNLYLAFVLKGIGVCLVPNSIWLVVYRNNEYFREVIKRVKRRNENKRKNKKYEC